MVASAVASAGRGGGRRRSAARLAAVQALYERDITGAAVTDVVGFFAFLGLAVAMQVVLTPTGWNTWNTVHAARFSHPLQPGQ